MGTPQIIFIALTALSLGVKAAKHGQESKVHFGFALIDTTIVMGLLFWGGFFG